MTRKLFSAGFAFALSLQAANAASLDLLGKLAHDESPKVRLEALRALAKVHNAQAAELALGVLDSPMDPTLDYALWLTINDLADPWIAALESGAWKPDGKEKQLEFALKAIKPEKATRVLSSLLKTRPLSQDGSGPWIEVIGQAGGPNELQILWNQTVTHGFSETASVRALNSLAQAASARKQVPSGDLKGIVSLYATGGQADPGRVAALKLALAWKASVKPEISTLAQLANSADSSPAVKFAAVDGLRALGGDAAANALASLAAPTAAPEIRRHAVTALLAVNQGKALPLIASIVPTLDDETAALEFWRAALSVKGIGPALADALPASGIPTAGARAGMRVAREGGRNELNLVIALGKASGLAADGGTITGELVAELVKKASQKGDPNRGEWVYRRNELACVSCHSVGGVGGKVGPDLTSIGASAQPDYLVESVLLPSAKIKEGYHAVMVTTKGGDDYAGTLARETPQELVLRLASGAEQAIAKSDIAKREQGTASLMPSGLLDNLGEQDQADLFAFLSRLGKPGDFDASKGGVARKWYLTQTAHTDQQAGQESWPFTTAFNDKRWTPRDALVRGVLSKEIVDEATKAQFWTSRLGIFAGTEIKVAQAGKVSFTWTTSPGAELWVNGGKVGSTSPASVELAPGTYRVVVRMDPAKIPASFKVESSDASFVLN
ncbi:MAG TPA: hypothetical protein VMF06_07800 [Candidatus Limnocylindria bacterium]|nr:hypothetical protein [Candidatus Limnocylindria bacterium]